MTSLVFDAPPNPSEFAVGYGYFLEPRVIFGQISLGNLQIFIFVKSKGLAS